MLKYIIPLLTLFFIGCESSKKDFTTYFGGKIINPKGEFVYVSNLNGVLDSIPVKSDNTFLGKFESLQEGLYYFKHGSEFQYMYLQPSDSLLIRLNTWDFDESIVFSGTNANRNNTLIELFLQNEKDDKEFFKYYDLNETDFKHITDSLLSIKKRFFNDYKTQNKQESKRFLNILKIAATYPVYRKTESYSMYNAEKKEPQQLSKSVFKYRDNINLNQDSLFFFSPYNDLVITKLYNDIYLQGYKKHTSKFNSALLLNIDKHIKDTTIKNQLLKQIIISHFYKQSSCDIDEESFNTFFSLCTNNAYKKKIKSLINDAKVLHEKHIVPSFTLISSNNKGTTSDKLIKNKNTVLYFRNPKHSSDEWMSTRLNYLIKKYPTINFYLININNDNKKFVKNLNLENQYYLPKDSKAHNFLSSRYSRLILIDKKGNIKNGFAGLSSNKIENQIADLQKE